MDNFLSFNPRSLLNASNIQFYSITDYTVSVSLQSAANKRRKVQAHQYYMSKASAIKV